MNKELIDLKLSARDHIKMMLDDPYSADKEKAGEIIESLEKLSSAPNEQKGATVSPASPFDRI